MAGRRPRMLDRPMMPLLWVDVETLGLEPKQASLLSVAMAATDEHLRITHEVEVFRRPAQREIDEAPSKVVQWHTENGLLKECRSAGVSVGSMEARLSAWLDKHELTGRYLAGSNPGFDRGWLKAWVPVVLKRFHYRSFDVNTVLAWEGLDKDTLVPRDSMKHRGIEDIRRDVAMLRRLRGCDVR